MHSIVDFVCSERSRLQLKKNQPLTKGSIEFVGVCSCMYRSNGNSLVHSASGKLGHMHNQSSQSLRTRRSLNRLVTLPLYATYNALIVIEDI